MCARQLRVNEGPSCSKQSNQLVLEEHAHCEVPAGCGGVVLRWRNPQQGMPVIIWLYATGDAQVFVDGALLTSARPILAFGEHVLSIRLSNLPPPVALPSEGSSWFNRLGFGRANDSPGQGLLMLAMRCSSQPLENFDVPVDPSQILFSLDDGTWKYVIEPPESDHWQLVDFDDSRWQALVRTPIAEPAEKEYLQKYRHKKLRELGAVAIGVPMEIQAAHIRKKFILTPDSIR
jgi:hypothetical protein